jgi:hypothetical protein
MTTREEKFLISLQIELEEFTYPRITSAAVKYAEIA